MYGRRCGRNSRQLPPLPQSSDDDEDEDEEQEEEDEDAADRGGAGGARGRAPSSPPVSFKVNQSELNAGFLKLSALVKPLLDKVKQHFAGDPAKQKTALQEIDRQRGRRKWRRWWSGACGQWRWLGWWSWAWRCWQRGGGGRFCALGSPFRSTAAWRTAWVAGVQMRAARHCACLFYSMYGLAISKLRRSNNKNNHHTEIWYLHDALRCYLAVNDTQ